MDMSSTVRRMLDSDQLNGLSEQK